MKNKELFKNLPTVGLIEEIARRLGKTEAKDKKAGEKEEWHWGGQMTTKFSDKERLDFLSKLFIVDVNEQTGEVGVFADDQAIQENLVPKGLDDDLRSMVDRALGGNVYDPEREENDIEDDKLPW